MTPDVESFFDRQTNTVSYVVSDPQTKHCAVFDTVLDFNQASGRTSTQTADRLIHYIRAHQLVVDWIIETHVHADHITAAPHIQRQCGGRIAIGQEITTVQQVFGEVFHEDDRFHRDGSQFDHLFTDAQRYKVGELDCQAMHTPGHTPACMSHLIGDALFVGDTLFMPDYGTARCDFPGGDAGMLYDSIQKIFTLPDETRIFLCHDYKPEGRDHHVWESTVGAQKRTNIHLAGISREEFIALRQARDAQLGMPKLILPAVQVNMRAGHMPPPEDNGRSYLKLPINMF